MKNDDQFPLVAVLEGFTRWLQTGACKIKNESGRIVPLMPGRAQKRLLLAMLRQAKAGKPIRVICLKSRKATVSTLIQALAYYTSKEVSHWSALTVAHTIEATRNIFSITRRIRKFDPAHEGAKLPAGGAKRVEFSEKDSVFQTSTAGGHFVGSGDTVNMLHLSELPKWPGAMEAVTDQLLSLMNAVPEDLNTIIFIESTANMSDVTGMFERYWREAVAGQNSFEPVFIAWFDKEAAEDADISKLGELDEYEKGLVEAHKLKPQQIAWYRRVLRDKHQSNMMLMRQEHPSTAEEAFQVATGRIYPMLELAKHDKVVAVSEWNERYRGIDWGGAHPFVCLWVAHRPGPPAFTVDVSACPNTWKQLTTWKRDALGKPHGLGDDACDAIRYVATTFSLVGWIHVYRELFVEDSAARGLSPLDMARSILRLTPAEEDIVSSVADRSQPGNIQLFVQQGIPCMSAIKPKTVERGEIEDGISRLQALMVATVPLEYPGPDPTCRQIVERMRQRTNMPKFSISELGLRLEMLRARSLKKGRAHPLLGVYC